MHSNTSWPLRGLGASLTCTRPQCVVFRENFLPEPFLCEMPTGRGENTSQLLSYPPLLLHTAASNGVKWTSTAATQQFTPCKSFKYTAWSVKSGNCQQTSTWQKSLLFITVKCFLYSKSWLWYITTQTKIWNKWSPKIASNLFSKALERERAEHKPCGAALPFHPFGAH